MADPRIMLRINVDITDLVEKENFLVVYTDDEDPKLEKETTLEEQQAMTVQDMAMYEKRYVLHGDIAPEEYFTNLDIRDPQQFKIEVVDGA